MTVSCSKKVPEWVNITTRYLANAKQATGPQNLENLFPSLFQSTDKINRVTSHNYLFPSNFGFTTHHLRLLQNKQSSQPDFTPNNEFAKFKI